MCFGLAVSAALANRLMAQVVKITAPYEARRKVRIGMLY
jgi:hypothetical protein